MLLGKRRMEKEMADIGGGGDAEKLKKGRINAKKNPKKLVVGWFHS